MNALSVGQWPRVGSARLCHIVVLVGRQIQYFLNLYSQPDHLHGGKTPGNDILSFT